MPRASGVQRRPRGGCASGRTPSGGGSGGSNPAGGTTESCEQSILRTCTGSARATPLARVHARGIGRRRVFSADDLVDARSPTSSTYGPDTRHTPGCSRSGTRQIFVGPGGGVNVREVVGGGVNVVRAVVGVGGGATGVEPRLIPGEEPSGTPAEWWPGTVEPPTCPPSEPGVTTGGLTEAEAVGAEGGRVDLLVGVGALVATRLGPSLGEPVDLAAPSDGEPVPSFVALIETPTTSRPAATTARARTNGERRTSVRQPRKRAAPRTGALRCRGRPPPPEPSSAP